MFSLQTYHHHQFRDAALLCARKEAAGETISVVIPTRNEAATVGEIIRTIRHAWMDACDLVDEIIVMDSGSSDDTRAIAQAAGAVVHTAEEVAAEWGNYPGKGENLWKSQFVSRGSLCVFIDGDILNFHPGYIAGLVGPLLENPLTQYVKAFYQRPLQVDGEPTTHSGGRVSELLVRPLFSLFYPQLCALHQPLAGEYAVRRSLLERLSFPCGYSVETAHLIDGLGLAGIDAFAQCDLDSRLHRNRPLDELGVMACTILHAFLQRAERDGKLLLTRPTGENCLQHQWLPQGWQMRKTPVIDHERPPFSSLTAIAR
jgi:glucosyl-3-phosphoglycerate synthase